MTSPHNHTWTVFIDGASRNNPGKAGAGIFIKKDQENVIIEGFYLGIKTNNQAEYLALLLGLFFINQYAQPGDMIRIISDSQLLVKQFIGEYKVKNEGLKPLHMLAHKLARPFNIDIMHVLREDNKKADELANKGIDSQKLPPPTFIRMLEEHTINF
jgi:ribonuclease HI